MDGVQLTTAIRGPTLIPAIVQVITIGNIGQVRNIIPDYVDGYNLTQTEKVYRIILSPYKRCLRGCYFQINYKKSILGLS